MEIAGVLESISLFMEVHIMSRKRIFNMLEFNIVFLIDKKINNIKKGCRKSDP